MISIKQFSDEIQKDGLSLEENELTAVNIFLTRLAQIEYDFYSQRKSKIIDGNSKEPLDISLNHLKLAA